MDLEQSIRKVTSGHLDSAHTVVQFVLREFSHFFNDKAEHDLGSVQVPTLLIFEYIEVITFFGRICYNFIKYKYWAMIYYNLGELLEPPQKLRKSTCF